jgi:D-alanyl-D-alanine dipeptidase
LLCLFGSVSGAASSKATSIDPADPYANDWGKKPIPTYASTEGTASYHTIPFDFGDKRSKERLITLSKTKIASEPFYAREDGLNAPYYSCVCKSDGSTLTREGIAQKLERVNSALKKYGFELLVLDAYRPVSCQRALWDYFIERGKEVLKNASEKDLVDFAAKYCSDPRKFDKSDQTTWPTHSTGGAVDLTLRARITKQQAYMGGIFDDASSQSASTYFENKKDEDLSASDVEARKNRRILYWAMTEAGFQNYANEWWHYDYGTQLWAKKTNRLDPNKNVKAFYGTMEDPRMERGRPVRP